jgi:putative membrane protein
MIIPDVRMSWFRLLFQVRGSALPKIRARLFVVFLVAVAVTAASRRMGGLTTDITAVPFTLISLALGVFLGFRNNTSYDRYWEGRKLWGRLVNDARSFARITLTMIGDDVVAHSGERKVEARALQQALIYRVIAFVHALRLSLRNELAESTKLRSFLADDELAALREQRNAPSFIALRLSMLVSEARRRSLVRHRDVHLFENLITDMVDVQGGCERIRATPIPWSYTVLMHTIVAAYCLALPFGLVATTKLWTPIVVVLIAYAFLGLDAVGDELEQPFGHEDNDLPLEVISQTIEVNLRQFLGETDLPALSEPEPGSIVS